MSDVAAQDAFLDELAGLGFVPVQQDRRGVLQLARTPNRFLTQWVHDDGVDVLFTWEFDLGEYVAERDWQIGAAETSLQVLYPQRDVRLPRDLEAVAAEIERVERQLAAVDLAEPER